MGELKEFLKSKVFFINLGIAIVLLALVFGGASKFLAWYTRHGDYIVLPDLSKKSLPDVQALLKSNGLKAVVIDSSYDEKLPPKTVINQVPYIGAHVKTGRNIYLYITSAVAPMIEIPQSGVKDAPLASARMILERDGIKIERTEYKVDICVGCVLSVIYKGKELEPGDKLQVGSKVTLVIGQDGNSGSDGN